MALKINEPNDWKVPESPSNTVSLSNREEAGAQWV